MPLLPIGKIWALSIREEAETDSEILAIKVKQETWFGGRKRTSWILQEE